jgi:hypothetical protein
LLVRNQFFKKKSAEKGVSADTWKGGDRKPTLLRGYIPRQRKEVIKEKIAAAAYHANERR